MTPDLKTILAAVERFAESYVACSSEQRAAVTLWAVHTHCSRSFYCTPYLHVSSAEPSSGKTRLLEVLEAVTYDPVLTASITPSALYRLIDEKLDPPTLLIDEVDAVFSGNGRGDASDRAEALRSVINSGYKRGGRAIRCDGPRHDVVRFSTYAPKALGGLARLPDTIRDRSIPIRLNKRKPSEYVGDWDGQMVEESQAPPIRAALVEWAKAAAGELGRARPDAPAGLTDRQREIWRALFAIADMAGGDWPERARSAALKLAHVEVDEVSIGVRLLGDIRDVLDGFSAEWVSTADLIARLSGLEESPWGSWRQTEKPITSRALGAILRNYGVKSRQSRVGVSVLRGYDLDPVRDAFERYLAPQSATPATSAQPSGFPADPNPLQDAECSGLGNGAIPHEQRDVAGVALRIQELGS